MFWKFLLLFHPICLHAFELCDRLEKNPVENVTYRVTVSNSSEICEDLDYTVGESLIHNIGDVYLYLKSEPPFMELSVTFNFVKHWTKALIKISDYDQKACQAFTVDRDQYSMDNLQFGCILNEAVVDHKNAILLQVYSDSDSQFSQKKILFSLPNYSEFRNVSFSTPRPIFSYIDFTNPAKIVLKIQPLNEIFKVYLYKVEVFKKKLRGVVLPEFPIFSTFLYDEMLSFTYDTQNEEGYYYFAISEIGQYCPEDACLKTFTPKVLITRKSKPLVIGIIGACYLSYFFLFSFFWWEFRNRSRANLKGVQKCVVLTKKSFYQHNDVVFALVQAILNVVTPRVLTVNIVNLPNEKQREAFEKFCSNTESFTLFIYVNPPSSDFDCCSLDFLNEEIKKLADLDNFAVVQLPYSKSEIPEILSNCKRFELMKDYKLFMSVFSNICTDHFKMAEHKNLTKLVELAATENEALLGRVPEIVVTDDGKEPGEGDGLIESYC